ncbi:MAG: adenylyltransferase/cytidyltransferase family protein [Magnetococcales bacterium]|nr:adenylyltransferase/cytidyltransferase family protein [Magnetococcales bacterium]
MLDTNNKIQTLDTVGKSLKKLRDEGKQIIHCHGTFDLLHPGHLHHLKLASQLGDLLVVTLTADRFVSKGPGRPAFGEQLRAESMAALACVDIVCIVHDVTGIPAIEAIKPHLYVKGGEYKKVDDDITGNMEKEENAVKAGGGTIHYTDGITFSSSKLLNQHFSLFPPEVKEYLQKFKTVYGASEVAEQINNLQGLKVLVVGDAIIDEYCTVSPMGVTGKNIDVLASKFESMERFCGGALAVANQIAGFVSDVTVLTGLGKKESHEPFIRSKLADNINPAFFYFEDAPTLIKRRFIDENLNKLFELYFYEAKPLTPTLDKKICQWIADHANSYDAVIVPDYGNGFISENIVTALCDHSGFLAVHTQINSGSRGYHAITRYPRADYISLNIPELRHAAHDHHTPINDLVIKVGKKLNASNFSVTKGADGALMCDINQETIKNVPALSTQMVDRIGASDSFFAMTSLCMSQQGEQELALFLGGAVAGLNMRIVCNRESIDPVKLQKFTTTLLK